MNGKVREIYAAKYNQMDLLELKTIISKILKSLGGFNSTMEMTAGRGNELEDRSIVNVQLEQRGENNEIWTELQGFRGQYQMG